MEDTVEDSNGNPETTGKPKLLCSARLTLSFLCLVAIFNVSCVRIGLPLTIVCMTTPLNGNPEGKGEFDWSSTVKGYLISAVFYGFILGPFIAGFLSFKYGGKMVLIISSITTGATNFFMPEAAKFSTVLFFAVRVTMGFFASFTFPAFYGLLTHWALPEERQLLIGGALVGIPLASIFNFPFITFICENLGWIWIFYTFAFWLILCGVVYVFTTYDYPENCPYISAGELNYLKNCTPKTDNVSIPWKHIMKSLPIYAYVVMHFCVNYVYLSMITSLPLLMEDVYHLTLEENGVLSATPYIGSFLTRVLISLFFEHLRAKLNLSKNAMRKIFISIGTILVILFLMVVTFLSRSYWYLSLACFVGASCSLELCITAGYLLSVLDLCPSYVNIVTGVANSIGNIAGLVGPVVNGWITVHGTKDEWNIVFYVTVIVLLLATIFYLFFGQNHLLYWGIANRSLQPPLPRASIVT